MEVFTNIFGLEIKKIPSINKNEFCRIKAIKPSALGKGICTHAASNEQIIEVHFRELHFTNFPFSIF